MSGNPHEPHAAIRFGLLDRFDRAALPEDAIEVGLASQIVKLPEIEPIRAEPFEAVV
jgi:hypothetical protein